MIPREDPVQEAGRGLIPKAQALVMEATTGARVQEEAPAVAGVEVRVAEAAAGGQAQAVPLVVVEMEKPPSKDLVRAERGPSRPKSEALKAVWVQRIGIGQARIPALQAAKQAPKEPKGVTRRLAKGVVLKIKLA